MCGRVCFEAFALVPLQVPLPDVYGSGRFCREAYSRVRFGERCRALPDVYGSARLGACVLVLLLRCCAQKSILETSSQLDDLRASH